MGTRGTVVTSQIAIGHCLVEQWPSMNTTAPYVVVALGAVQQRRCWAARFG
jgi:hypothetical protein